MGRKHKKAPEAFPGDTYIADLKKSNQADVPWIKVLPFAIAIAVIADWYFMQDTLALVMDWASLDSLYERNPNIVSMILCELSAFAIIAIYLGVGMTAGKSFKRYLSFRKRGSLALFIICMFVEIGALVIFTLLRYYGELGNPDVDSPEAATAMMSTFMLLAAFMTIVYNIVAGDSVAINLALEAEKRLPDDRALYCRTFSAYANNAEKDREYERREREIDRLAIESAFRLSSIASKLNGVLDPADVYDFQAIRHMAINDYYESPERAERGK